MEAQNTYFLNKIDNINEHVNFDVYKYSDLLSVGFIPKHCNESDYDSFLKYQELIINSILNVKLNYKKPENLSIFIVPDGELYKSITGFSFESGMCTRNTRYSSNYPSSIIISENGAKNQEVWDRRYKKLKENTLLPSVIKGTTHEWTHILLNQFYNTDNTVILEGLADLMPLYMLDLQSKMPNYINRLKMLKPGNKDWKNGEICSYNFIKKHDMFFETDEIMEENGLSPRDSQNRISYRSTYLFMLGTIKKIEELQNVDKVEALNIFLQEFGKSKNEDEELECISKLTGLSKEEITEKTTLQEYGQNFIKNDVKIITKNKQINKIKGASI